jgi:hypothetical protein
MAEQFLAIKEKNDAEALIAFKSTQEDIISAMTLGVKKSAIVEAQKTLESLEETRRSHESRLSFYRRLVGEDDKTPGFEADWQDIIQDIDAPTKDELRMSRNERLEFNLTEEAEKLNLKASTLDTIAGAMKAFPGIEENIEPVGCGVTMKFDANNIADFMMITASVFRLNAEMKSNDANKASRKAQLIRQLQERRMQANLAGHDIATLDKQIAGQRIRVKMAEADVAMQEKLMEQSEETDKWLRDKFVILFLRMSVTRELISVADIPTHNCTTGWAMPSPPSSRTRTISHLSFPGKRRRPLNSKRAQARTSFSGLPDTGTSRTTASSRRRICGLISRGWNATTTSNASTTLRLPRPSVYASWTRRLCWRLDLRESQRSCC